METSIFDQFIQHFGEILCPVTQGCEDNSTTLFIYEHSDTPTKGDSTVFVSNFTDRDL